MKKKHLMKEDFLHYIWQHKLLSLKRLHTFEGKELVILHSGTHNTNSGPDFLNAKLKINEVLWVGNVEIHINSSDWYLHQHENNAHYDAVILHVVWRNDVAVFMKNNLPLPTLELQHFIDKQLLANYKSLFSNLQYWIPCQVEIAKVDTFLFNHWLARLYFERLEQKSLFIKELLQKSNMDFEAVLFQLLAKNFGLKTNATAFFSLATSLEFSVIRKVRFNKEALEGLLFGQAGFLEEITEEPYQKELKETYSYLKHKFNLTPIAKQQFQFFRMRPANFPTIRIAQLVALFSKHQQLFSKLMEINNLDEFYTLFTVEVSDFWKTHYTFGKVSKKSSKKLTVSFINLLLINTIIPLKFVYQKETNSFSNEAILDLISQLKPEKNSIISMFSKYKIKAQNAFESQALLQLKNKYCNSKKCLDCAIGNFLLQKNRV